MLRRPHRQPPQPPSSSRSGPGRRCRPPTRPSASRFVVPAGVHQLDVALTGARAAALRRLGGRGALVAARCRSRRASGCTPRSAAPARTSAAEARRRRTRAAPTAAAAGSPAAAAPRTSARRHSPRRPRSRAGGWSPPAAAGEPATAGRPGGDAGAPGGRGATRLSSDSPARSRTAAPAARRRGRQDGTAGILGLGGDGMAPSFRGGGGGGGLYGGGGGAGERACNPCGFVGGGGGGSSLVPAGGTSGLAAAGRCRAGDDRLRRARRRPRARPASTSRPRSRAR